MQADKKMKQSSLGERLLSFQPPYVKTPHLYTNDIEVSEEHRSRFTDANSTVTHTDGQLNRCHIGKAIDFLETRCVSVFVSLFLCVCVCHKTG